jgi:hypothetical protein
MRRVASVASILALILTAADSASARGAGGARGGRAQFSVGHLRAGSGWGHLVYFRSVGLGLAHNAARGYHGSSFGAGFGVGSGPLGWHHLSGRGWRRYQVTSGANGGPPSVAASSVDSDDLSYVENGVAAVATRTGMAYPTGNVPGFIRRLHYVEIHQPYFPHGRRQHLCRVADRCIRASY